MISGQFVGTDQYQMCNLAMYYPEEAAQYFCSNGGEQYASVCQYGVPQHAMVMYLDDANNYPVIVCYSDDIVADQGEYYTCDHMVRRNLIDKVPLDIGGYSTGGTYQYTIRNYEMFNCEVQERCWDTGWQYYSTGVQVNKSGQSCASDGSCTGGTTQYRCAGGYYGYSSSGVPTCKSCATTGFSNATSVAGSNSTIYNCYLPKGNYSDLTGSFSISPDKSCYYSDGDVSDHVLRPCSELIAAGCKVPALSHTCYADYNKAISGATVCVDCSALDTADMKMLNRCIK